jgi:hypothetical protein
MKKLMALISLTLALASIPAFAKTDAPPTYPLTGTVAISVFHSDSSASITVNGQTTSAYCSTEGTNISCTDTAGVFEVKLSDGRTLVLGDEAFLVMHGQLGWKTVYSPLAHSLIDSGKKSDTFQYRLASFKIMGTKDDYLCVPFSTEDKKGKPTPGEACYSMMFAEQPTRPTQPH